MVCNTYNEKHSMSDLLSWKDMNTQYKFPVAQYHGYL